jgi:hypothetical protein
VRGNIVREALHVDRSNIFDVVVLWDESVACARGCNSKSTKGEGKARQGEQLHDGQELTF